MSLDFWRNISVIWLSLLCFIGLLPPLAIGYFLVRGMNWVLSKERWLFDQAQLYSGRARAEVDRASGYVVEPLIAVRKRGAQVDATVSRLRRDLAAKLSPAPRAPMSLGNVTIVSNEPVFNEPKSPPRKRRWWQRRSSVQPMPPNSSESFGNLTVVEQ